MPFIAASAANLPVIFEPGGRAGEFIARVGSSAVTVTSTGVRFDSEVALRLVGARVASSGEALQPLPGTSNYFHGSDRTKWRQGVPHYGRLRFHDVYQGIDVVYYGSEGRLEYDFLAGPGADLTAIRLAFSGTVRVEETASGDLRAVTRRGELVHRRPLVAEEGRRLGSHYVRLSSSDFGIEIDGRNATRAVVIDPVIESATYFGGGTFESAHAMKLDAQGNVYLAGEAPSPGVFASGPFSSATNPGQDALVIKFSPQTNTIGYYVFLGGDQPDIAYALAVDSSGAAYLTGSTASVNFPVANGFQMTPGGGTLPDAFVTKIAPDGKSLVYSSYLGGSGSDQGFAVAVDLTGAAYVGGTTASRNFSMPAGGFQTTFGASVLSQVATGFLVAVDPTGAKLDSGTLLGGSVQDSVQALAFDPSGNLYAAGVTTSPDFPVRAGIGSVLPSSAAGFASRLTPDLSQLLYSTYLSGGVAAIAVDAQGSLIAGGSTNGVNFPLRNAPQTVYGGGSTDAFVVRLTPAGDDYLFATYFGGSDTDAIRDLAIEQSGLLTVVGSTQSTDFPQRNGLQPFQGQNGAHQAFVAKFLLSNNSLAFSTLLGGAGGAYANGVQVDGTGVTYVAGTAGGGFPATSGAYQSQYGGGTGDMFLAVLSADPNIAGAAPALSVTPTVLSFVASQGSAAPPSALPVTVTSTSGTVGAFTVDWSGTKWLSANLPSGQTPATFLVFVNQAGLAVGVYTGTIRVIPGDGSPLIPITVTLTVANPAPSIVAINPPHVPVGSPDTVFTLTGAGFVSSSEVQLFLEDGTLSQTISPPAASTTSSSLQFTIGQSLLFRDTLLRVRVKNPDSPMASNSVAVQVGDRFPTIMAIANTGAGTQSAGNAIAPGEYVTITGSTLGPALPLGVLLENGATAATEVGNVQVLFGGIAAPLLSVADGRVIAVTPWGLAGQQTTQIVVEYLGVRSNPVSVSIAPAAPGLFTADGSGAGQGLIFNDSGLSNAAFLPAAKGSVISLYFTGAGVMSPGETDGQIAAAIGNGPSLPVSVMIDGVVCDLISVGDAVGEVSGMVQVSVRVPATVRSGSAIPIQVTVGGASSQAGVVVAIQ
ncbi:MAG TPA: hypothetical protein VGL53_28385 [Bryobacteraceae bacterium]